MMKAIHWRGLDFYDPERTKHHALIVGAGHIGSFVAYGLARLGVHEITLVDFDIVEDHNLPHQFIPETIIDGSVFKASAVYTAVKYMTNKDINVEICKIEESSAKELDWDVMFLCPDNMSTRKWCYHNIRAKEIIDIRTGGLFVNIYSIKTSSDEQKRYYEEHLYDDDVVQNLPCTGQGIIDVSMASASLGIGRYRMWSQTGENEIIHTFHDFKVGTSWIMHGQIEETEYGDN